MSEPIPVRESQSDESEWLLAPELPQGLQIQLGGVVAASEVSEEVLALIGRAMTEMQKPAKVQRAANTSSCPKLKSCSHYVGGCSQLVDCGNYKLQVADAVIEPPP